MNKILLMPLLAMSASCFAAENNISDSLEQLCEVQNGGEMLSLSSSQWSSIPSDSEHSEILLFENGVEVLLSNQEQKIQDDVTALFNKSYDAYVCVNQDGLIAPIYKRVK